MFSLSGRLFIERYNKKVELEAIVAVSAANKSTTVAAAVFTTHDNVCSFERVIINLLEGLRGEYFVRKFI